MFRKLPDYLFKMDPVSKAYEKVLDPPELLFSKHPLDVIAYMEAYWNKRKKDGSHPLGHPDNLSEEDAFSLKRLPLPQDAEGRQEELLAFTDNDPKKTPIISFDVRWDHLIYAYMIENTRVYEIFRRVLHEYRHGEKIGTPQNSAMQNWLRNTEQLFHSDSAPFLITNVSSHIRSDLRANRRNAYQRMFGMDLNHGTDDGKPFAYIKAEAANSEFVATFEEFLREVWVGITYVNATSSSNPTDNAKISELATKLKNMLQSRRQRGNLSREEFAFVSLMAWFHMSLELDESPILESLQAKTTGVEQRLFKIAERVGLPAHGLSRDFFEIADPMSCLLIQIEMGTYDNVSAVPALYEKIPDGPAPDIAKIITHWTAITGRDVKARKVAAN